MDQKIMGTASAKIIFFLFTIILINSCGVIKTPYFKTEYYEDTIKELEETVPVTSGVSDSIYAGFSKISITPEISLKEESGKKEKNLNVPIAGFGQLREKIATGIHDSIFVKAVALRSGYQTIIVISGDILLMPPNIIDEVSSQLQKEGINRNQLFFSATHTHSSIGGWGYGVLARLMAGKERPQIEKWLTECIKEAVLTALNDIKPAMLGFGSFNGSVYTRNRLTGNPLEKNDDFDYIILEQPGYKKAVIGSFSAHSTTVGSKNTLISGDYPGYWERKMENSDADFAMFCAGSMGSQSPVGQGSDFERARYIGESLADSTLLRMSTTNLSKKALLSTLTLRMYLPEYHMRLTININLSSGLSNKMMPYPENVYLQGLRINNLVWIFTPGDFSGEMALTVKSTLAGKGYNSLVTGYNGSYVGYIIPSKYFYLDNYEAIGMGWFGPTMGDYTMDLINRICNSVISEE